MAKGATSPSLREKTDIIHHMCLLMCIFVFGEVEPLIELNDEPEELLCWVLLLLLSIGHKDEECWREGELRREKWKGWKGLMALKNTERGS